MTFSEKNGSGKNVLLIYDTPDWAFHGQAKGLINNSTSNINYDLVQYVDPRNMYLDKYDVIFCLGMLMCIHPALRCVTERDFITLVHHYPSEAGLDFFVNANKIKEELEMGRKALRVGAISKKISQLWFREHELNTFYLPSGIDVDKFRPRYKRNKKFTVGFCGNVGKKLKGYNDFILPAINRLKQKGLNIELKTRGFKDLISHDQMPVFYRDIDLYICASSAEGLPTPLVEASACGIPFVSTNVGVVKEIDAFNQNIIVDRTVDSLSYGIEQMYNKQEHERRAIGSINRQVIEAGWAWEVVAPIWEAYILNNFKLYDDLMKKREEAICQIK